MSRMSLMEVLNPSEWRRHREHAERVEIEVYKVQQRDAHHRDEIALGYDKLRFEGQRAEYEARQLENHHQDRMNALARRDNLDNAQHLDRMNALTRRDELDERRYMGALEVDRERLNYDQQKDARANQTALTIADIQAQNALELARLNHENSLDLIRTQGHIDLMRATSLLPVQMAESALRRGEDQNRAISGAIADAFRAKIGQKMAEKLEDQKERHRSNERRHEIKMAILNAKLDVHGFTQKEIAQLIIRLVDPTTATADQDENALFQRFSQWFEGAKKDF